LVTTVFGQNEKYKSIISFNAAISLYNASVMLEGFGRYSIPTLQLEYDYGITKHVSLGGALSYQRLGCEYDNFFDSHEPYSTKHFIAWSYIGDRFGEYYFSKMEIYNRLRSEHFISTIDKTNIAFRCLFHYANIRKSKRDKFDIYQGIRIA